MKLTNKAIRSYRYRGGWDVRWDDKVPGLGLRVYPSGKKAFVLSYRHRRRKRLMVLGVFGIMTLDQARARARKERVKVDEGIDPLEEKRRIDQGESFKHLADAYIENHAKPNKKTWKEDERRLNQHPPASWKRRRADAITRTDVEKVYTALRARGPYEANRLLALLRHLFNWGKGRAPSYIGKDAIKDGWENPATEIQRFREQKRSRRVEADELPFIARAIDTESNLYVRAAVWLYLLTGLRKRELLTTRREDVNFNRGTLRLPDTKAGEEQAITLSKPALAIMQALPALKRNPYLLPGAKPRQHLVNIEQPWQRIRTAATVEIWAQDKRTKALIRKCEKRLERKQLERKPTIEEIRTAAEREGVDLSGGVLDVRLHDLRRTVGSWMTDADVDLNKIKAALRHSDIATTLTYARLGEDATREAMEEHGRRIMEAAGRKGPLAVVEGGGGKD